MNLPIAMLDACVLYSAALRDLFMWLATAGLYLPRWTERIHAEWIENVLKNRPDLSAQKLERTRQLMNLHAVGSLVEDYESLIPTLALPDQGDRHVLAAAIAAEASIIVTFNLADFPNKTLATYGVEAQHPDVFLGQLFDAEPAAFVAALQEMVAELKNPPRTLEQHLDVLRAQRLFMTADRVAATLSQRAE